MHQMSFPKPNASVKEERIVGLPGVFGHRLRGGLSETIGMANHKRIKRVTRIEMRFERRSDGGGYGGGPRVQRRGACTNQLFHRTLVRKGERDRLSRALH